VNNKDITKPIREAEKRMKEAVRDLPLIMGNEALLFARRNFKEGGFTDTGFQKWRQRKNPTAFGDVPRPNRALLVDSGRLRNSGMINYTTLDGVQLIWDVPYAKAHNEGINGIGVIQTVKPFTRKNGQKVKEHERRITMRLSKRQFIGRSQVLSQNVLRHSLAHINKTLKR
jgi:hypothetical protein